MSPADIQAIEFACTKLINQFAVYSDAARYDDLAALFTEDGRYARPTDPTNFIVGHADLLSSFKARPKEKLTRHLVTNVIIDVTGPTTAKGFSYVTLYAGSTDKPAPTHGWRANPPQLVGEYSDDFVLTAAGWKIRQRSGRLVFTT